jgi:hypothetical protein
VTERRIVVLAFFAFLAVGAAVILVFASQPASHPSIQSGRGASTTQPHPATTSSTTPGTLPRSPTEVKGESATSGTAGPAPTPAAATTPAPTTAPPTATPPAVVPLTAAASPAAPPTTAPAGPAPPTVAPPTAAPPTTAAPTIPPPTTDPPPAKKEKPIPPGHIGK